MSLFAVLINADSLEQAQDIVDDCEFDFRYDAVGRQLHEITERELLDNDEGEIWLISR